MFDGWRDQDPTGTETVEQRCCEWPGCDAAGDYRAPHSPANLRKFRWFCLDHVRSYNREWDYFAKMSPEQIDAIRRADVTGHRPTWPMGVSGAAGFDFTKARFRDFFGTYRTEGGDPGKSGTFGAGERSATDEHSKAMAVLDLEPEMATKKHVKARYKTLVKLHHPDANGGDKASEERLKSINQAYTYLMNSGLP